VAKVRETLAVSKRVKKKIFFMLRDSVPGNYMRYDIKTVSG
jgi:hypothetical protein